jgi:hypothetical protein
MDAAKEGSGGALSEIVDKVLFANFVSFEACCEFNCIKQHVTDLLQVHYILLELIIRASADCFLYNNCLARYSNFLVLLTQLGVFIVLCQPSNSV